MLEKKRNNVKQHEENASNYQAKKTPYYKRRW